MKKNVKLCLSRQNIILLIIFFIGFIFYMYSSQEGNQEDIDQKNPLLKVFQSKYSNKVILMKEGDVTNDGIEDLIVIYDISKSEKRMVIVMGRTNTLTNSVKAPIERQNIKFKNIDEKDQMEFIVSGYKGSNLGYAIYRIENSRIVDLFGEGMDQCC
ncbi:Cys-Cys-COOH protein SaoC [Fusobacteria bacterium ZRK30]|nr:Cys-Cys-COOH protein SaoC [Fusobacteria bacterium ZRK30]